MKCIAIAFLSVVSYCSAMEVVKQDPSVPCDKICHLYRMPQQVKDLIADYLPWETKKAFVERTRINAHNQDKILWHSNVVSPDKSKEIILYPAYDPAVSIGLTFHNYKKKNTLIFRMPFAGHYDFRSLDFNKQGTYLAVRCFYAQSLEELRHTKRKKCILFLVRDFVQYEKQSGDKKEENRLEEYFRHHLVCKKIT